MARTSRFRIELLMPAAIRRLRTAASSLAGVLLAACIGSSNPFGYDKDSDRVVRWADRVGVKEIPPEGQQVYNLGCTLDALLAGAHCVDNRGLFGKEWNK